MTKRQPNTLRSDEAEPPNSTKVHLRKAPIFLKNQTTLMTNWFHDGGSARSPVLVVFTLKICTINCQWTPWINAWKLAKPGRSLLLQNIPPKNTKVAVNLKFSRAKIVHFQDFFLLFFYTLTMAFSQPLCLAANTWYLEATMEASIIMNEMEAMYIREFYQL